MNLCKTSTDKCYNCAGQEGRARMEKITDWTTLWRELAESPRWMHQDGANTLSKENDPWRERARDFDARTRRGFPESDPIQDLVASQVDGSTTVIDIGAGTGRWALFLSPRVKEVTAVDPSPAMLSRLRDNITRAAVQNVKVIEGFWPGVAVEPHDVSLCSHAIYASPDFPAFINRMIEVTRRTCYLLLRVPSPEGVMGEAFQYLYGQPHDSPNFIIGYNALLQMGIQASVLIAPHLRLWTSTSMEDALIRLKQRLGIQNETNHDAYLKELLRKRLIFRNDEFVWPDGMRSALVYWNTV